MFVLSLFALSLAACSLEKTMTSTPDVPAAVTEQFAGLHPNADKVKWDTEEDGSYEAEYQLNGKEFSNTYSAGGDLLETEEELKKDMLPAPVLATIKRDFAHYKIEEAARITYPDGRIVYEAELEGKDDAKFDALFAEDGTLIERVPSSD